MQGSIELGHKDIEFKPPFKKCLVDHNVLTATGTDGTSQSYVQDELGSPIRLMNEAGKVQQSYGYDEFGNDLYHSQSEIQPFGYTGYQRDGVAKTYYAQAREYRPEMGRFISEDVVRGSVNSPFTLNRYGYCWNRPLSFLDLNGQSPSDWIDDWTRKNLGVTLTDSEKALIALNPKEALIVRSCQQTADEWTVKVFGGMVDGDAANAYRHAMWNALIKQAFMSETNARIWTSAHEAFTDEQLKKVLDNGYTVGRYTDMDLHNNQMGLDSVKWYEFWVSSEEISNRILEKIKNGEMDYFIKSEYNKVVECP